ncbi:MAG: hypothetical protein KKA55_04895 [Proteobacteria bacterium]|nr:hypothetical protein [Pseudomonadota bacterium]MBU1594855.1 hypothetical protein [Pseudomonadota bacterium]
MHCIILLPGVAGRLPSAEELRQRGFSVSRAVALPEPAAAGLPAAQGPEADQRLPLAAEASAPYGRPVCPKP